MMERYHLYSLLYTEFDFLCVSTSSRPRCGLFLFAVGSLLLDIIVL